MNYLIVAGYVRCCAGAGYLEASYDDNKSVYMDVVDYHLNFENGIG